MIEDSKTCEESGAVGAPHDYAGDEDEHYSRCEY